MSAPMEQVAREFFDACEAGKGWQACSAYCTPTASFSSQAEPLAEVKTLQAYADWMLQHGILSQPIDVPRTFTNEFLPPASE